MTEKIKVGLDFDGVVAYNPFRVVRYPVAYFKKNILGIKKLRFWYPQHPWQQIFWKILHESSVFPAKGAELLKQLVREDAIEAHLISARYSFLDESLLRWLKKYELHDLFTTININKENEQPHLFKEKMVGEKKVDFFIEDNLDIVRYLSGKREAESGKGTKIYWIYNLVDRAFPHPYKYPYLEKALQNIVKS